MTVYIIRRKFDDTGMVKIGFTNDVERRLKDMSTGTPEGFDVIRQYDGGRSLEITLHKAMKLHRVYGEWFKLGPQQFAICDEMSRRFEKEEPHTRRLPTADDEYSQDIVAETRFYLNELAKREWEGMGDTVEEVHRRISVRLGIAQSYIFRIWYKPDEIVDVKGEAYRAIRLAYAEATLAEGALTEHQWKFLRAIGYWANQKEPSHAD